MLTFINNDSWYSINLKNCRADYKAPCQLCMVDEKVTTWREPPGSLFFIPNSLHLVTNLLFNLISGMIVVFNGVIVTSLKAMTRKLSRVALPL